MVETVPAAYLEDASGFTGTAEAFVAPQTAEEVAAILRGCSERGQPVTLSGAGTGVTGGRCAQGGLILSLERLQRLEIQPGFARVGAGLPLQALHNAAQANGQFYPPDPTEWSASVGGTIATNASGSRSFLYGPTRHWLRKLTVAFMDGTLREFSRGEKVDVPYQILPVPQSRKHTAGYYMRPDLDWVDLFCGSEGTLGVVVEAEVGLLPKPDDLLSGVVFFPSWESALDAVEQWRDVPALRMLEYLDGASVELLRPRFKEIPKAAGAALLVEQILDGLAGDPVDEWLERMDGAGALAEESWFGETAQDRERFRQFRHALPEIVNDRVRRNGFRKLGSDFAVPVARNVEMMRHYVDVLTAQLPGKFCIFGHIGDAHVHVNILPETQEDAALAREVMIGFARKSVELGGTVSAEHGLGKLKSHLLRIEFSDAEIAAMASLKRSLDPQWLLGRGTLLPVPGK